jgi:hypothetical protein
LRLCRLAHDYGVREFSQHVKPIPEFLDVRDDSAGLTERYEANDICDNLVGKLGHANDKFRDKIKLASGHIT